MNDYKVKDITLSDWGRKEIVIAQSEMPALMKLRERYGDECFDKHVYVCARPVKAPERTEPITEKSQKQCMSRRRLVIHGKGAPGS